MRILNNFFHYVLFALLIPSASFIHTAEQPINWSTYELSDKAPEIDLLTLELPDESASEIEQTISEIPLKTKNEARDTIFYIIALKHGKELDKNSFAKLINAISKRLGININSLVNITPNNFASNSRGYNQTQIRQVPLIFWVIASTMISLKNKKEIIEYLINHGANTNFTVPSLSILPAIIPSYVREGDTLLHIAARLGDQELFNILAGSGIDTTIRNAEGFTAQDILNRNPQTITETNRQESSSSRIGSTTINLNTQGRRAFRDRMGDFLNDMRSALDTLAGTDTK